MKPLLGTKSQSYTKDTFTQVSSLLTLQVSPQSSLLSSLFPPISVVSGYPSCSFSPSVYFLMSLLSYLKGSILQIFIWKVLFLTYQYVLKIVSESFFILFYSCVLLHCVDAPSWGCFQYFAFTNNAAINNLVHIYFHPRKCISDPRTGTAGSCYKYIRH